MSTRAAMWRVAAAAAVMVALAATNFGATHPIVALMAPAVVLLTLLLLGCYPGERRLAALAWPRAPRRVAPRVIGPRRPALASRPRGGRIIACSLAGRAPPRAGVCI
jgi:hypothetical protein